MIYIRVAALTAALLSTMPAAAQDILPRMEISRDTTPYEWAFAVDGGELACVAMGGQYHVFFSEPWPARISIPGFPMTLPRSVAVTTNPIALLASYEDRDLYAPFASLEELIRRLAPFEVMGKRLCLEDGSDKQE